MAGDCTTRNYLQTIDYAYNTRGWLTDINDFSAGDLFSFKLHYNELNANVPSGGANYNGNISQVEWQVKGTDNHQFYGFTYDGLDRLTAADYIEKNISSAYVNSDRYKTSYSYDLNGNIETLRRHGWHSATDTYQSIDNLSYTYASNGQLTQVQEQSSLIYGYKAPSSTNAYTYDNNGNMQSDAAKNMFVDYNYLNLPERIEFDSCKFVEIQYDAVGMKLSKVTKAGAIQITRQDYVGGIEYRNGELEAVYHEEGRVYFEGDSLRYEYTLRDHLGNTRVTFTDKDGDGEIEVTTNPETSEILQENHYYPFGMQMDGAWVANEGRENRYTYNSKEFNGDFGLDWLDYGARWYDAGIGRFTGVDPISDRFPHVSTYNYAENEPIANIDLWGLQKFYSADGNLIGSHGSSTEERVINEAKNIKLAQKVFSTGDPFQIETFVERDFLPEKFSKPLYRSDDLNQVYDEFAQDYKEASVEYVMTIYKKEFSDEDGNSFEGFQLGKVYTDNDKHNVFLGGSKFQGSWNWEIHSAIHNHPNGTDFSGYGQDSNDYPRYGFGVTNDLGWSIHENANVLLVTPKSNEISTFNPNIYNDIMTTGNLSKYRSYERNPAVRKAITKRKIGE